MTTYCIDNKFVHLCGSFLSLMAKCVVCCKWEFYKITWFSPKQSRSRNRPFILSTRSAHAHRCVVSATNFTHEDLHLINTTFVKKNWLRHLIWIPLEKTDTEWRLSVNNNIPNSEQNEFKFKKKLSMSRSCVAHLSH